MLENICKKECKPAFIIIFTSQTAQTEIKIFSFFQVSHPGWHCSNEKLLHKQFCFRVQESYSFMSHSVNDKFVLVCVQ